MIARHPFDPIESLDEALHFLRMSGIFYSRCEFTAPWGFKRLMGVSPGAVRRSALRGGSS